MLASFGLDLGKKMFPPGTHSGMWGSLELSGCLKIFLPLLLACFLVVSAYIFFNGSSRKLRVPKKAKLGLFTLCTEDTQGVGAEGEQ